MKIHEKVTIVYDSLMLFEKFGVRVCVFSFQCRRRECLIALFSSRKGVGPKIRRRIMVTQLNSVLWDLMDHIILLGPHMVRYAWETLFNLSHLLEIHKMLTY